MDIHKKARLTPHGRERIVHQVPSGRTVKAVAEAAGVCPRTVRKWLVRYRTEGAAGLQDRSSRPHRLHRPTPQPTVTCIEDLRRQRMTGRQIAKETGVSPATVSRILSRAGLSRTTDLQPAQPVTRDERDRPGELVTSTSRGSAGSTGPGTASPPTAPARATAAASDGNIYT